MIVETVKLFEIADVNARLGDMELALHTLLDVRDVAFAAAANATPFHAANAAGTFAYQDGTWALRDRHAGKNWRMDRTGGVESILNEAKGLRIIFANVDISCDDERDPKPRSPKGAGAERACQGNLFFGLELPRYATVPDDKTATYYLMMDPRGAVELSRPVVKGRTFSSFIERIYLSHGHDIDRGIDALDDSDRVEEFNPLVVRKVKP